MKVLLEKYKNETLDTAAEYDAFVDALLEIRAQRMQQHGQIQQPITTIKNKNPLRVLWITRLALAASLLLGGFFLWQQTTKSNDSLLADDIGLYSTGLVQQVRGAKSSTTDTLSSQLIELYENADYQGIISELAGKTLVKEQEKLCLGIAYANLKKPDFGKALLQLKQIYSDEYLQKRNMLIALCHIGFGETGAAKDTLNAIIQDGNSGDKDIKKAKELLGKIAK